MRFFCPGCGSKYSKPDEEIPEAGLHIPCEKCNFSISLKPPRRKTEAGMPAAGGKTSEPGPVKPPVKQKVDATEKIDSVQASEIEELGDSAQESELAQAPGDQPATTPKPKKKPEKNKKKKNEANKGIWTRFQAFGTGRSGDKFRFRDLLFAVVVPFDIRKLLVVAVCVAIGSVLMTFLGWVGAKAGGSTGATIGMVLGGLLFFVLDFLALGVTSHQTDKEMEAGKHLPMSVGFKFVQTRPLTVLGTPFFFVATIVLLCLVVLAISAIGRIPYAGPLLYGLAFMGTFSLALAAVLLGVLLLLVAFSYISVVDREQLGPRGAIKRVLDMLKKNPGPYLLHILLALAASVVLVFILNFLVGGAISLMGWIGSKGMGPNLSGVLLAIPLGLFAFVFLVMPDTLFAMLPSAADSGWQFDIAGVFVGIGLLLVASIVVAFVQVYFFGAGVVNYHLLVRKEDKRTGGE